MTASRSGEHLRCLQVAEVESGIETAPANARARRNVRDHLVMNNSKRRWIRVASGRLSRFRCYAQIGKEGLESTPNVGGTGANTNASPVVVVLSFAFLFETTQASSLPVNMGRLIEIRREPDPGSTKVRWCVLYGRHSFKPRGLSDLFRQA